MSGTQVFDYNPLHFQGLRSRGCTKVQHLLTDPLPERLKPGEQDLLIDFRERHWVHHKILAEVVKPEMENMRSSPVK
jgi:hypothetical protein